MTYLEFLSEIDETTNMGFYNVCSQKNGDFLGTIHYYPRWRQYVFTPYANTVWSKDCLNDVRNMALELTCKQKEIEKRSYAEKSS